MKLLSGCQPGCSLMKAWVGLDNLLLKRLTRVTWINASVLCQVDISKEHLKRKPLWRGSQLPPVQVIMIDRASLSSWVFTGGLGGSWASHPRLSYCFSSLFWAQSSTWGLGEVNHRKTTRKWLCGSQPETGVWRAQHVTSGPGGRDGGGENCSLQLSTTRGTPKSSTTIGLHRWARSAG